jgi:5,5'-dehydrodivanillate O-demethylase
VPYAEVPLTDENGKYVLDYVLGQDMVAWYEQGAITDRTQEHLGQSDTCVIAYRKLLAEQIEIVRNGGEPMNVFRDPSDNYRLELQIPGAEDVAPPIGEGNTVSYRGNFHKRSKGGWLYIDDDADRYCPDRDLIVELYERTAMIAQKRHLVLHR